MYNQKIAIIFDHWKTNQAELFAFDKFTLQNLANKSVGTCKPTFYNFCTSHLRWNSTMRPFFNYHTDLRQNAVFHNCTHSIFRTAKPSKHAWAFSETVQKISKITYTASRFSLLTSAKFAVNITRVTLQHNKEFVFIFLFHWFITMCNLKKAFDTRSILSTPASDVYERLKTNGKPIKIARDY